MISSVLEQIKNFSLHSNKHSDLHFSQSKDENYYRNHNGKNPEKELDEETAKQLLLDEIAIFNLN